MHYSALVLLCALSVVAAAPIAGKSVEARQNRHVVATVVDVAFDGLSDDPLKPLGFTLGEVVCIQRFGSTQLVLIV
jgi:hypothetical protein